MTFRTGLVLFIATIFPYSYDAVHYLPRTTTISLQSSGSSSSSSTSSIINTITELEQKDVVAINNHNEENLNHASTTIKNSFNNFSSISTDGPEIITSDFEIPSTRISEITILNEDQSTAENLTDATVTTLAPSKSDATTVLTTESSSEDFTSFGLPTSYEANDKSSVEEITSPDAVALDGENDDEGMTDASSKSATVNFSTTSAKILNIPSKTKNDEVTTKIFPTSNFVDKISQTVESKDVELSSINSTEKSINKSTTTLASGPNCNLETTTTQTPINILGLDEHSTAWVVVGALALVAVLATGLIHIFKKPKPSVESRRLIRFSSLHEYDSED